MLAKQMQSRKTRGFTLTEAAIVLGIVGLILGAIWVAAASVYNNLRVSQTSTQLLQMVQNIRSMHATTQVLDTSATNLALSFAQAGAIPKDMLDNAVTPTTVTNMWGGGVAINPTTVNVAGDSFRISFDRVPRPACSDLLTRNTGQGRDSSLVNAGTTTATYDNTGTNMPVTVTNALAACNSTANTGNNVRFVFMLKS